jgi:hypothetical protein
VVREKVSLITTSQLRYSRRFSIFSISYYFKISRPCHFQNGKVCPLVTSEAGARWPRSISNLWRLVSN